MIPPRIAPLLQQFDYAIKQLVDRVDGMTDEEYLWEPVVDCWSVRRREECRTSHPFGNGDWVLDATRPEPEPPPFTTLAWRITHLSNGLAERAHYAGHAGTFTVHDFPIHSTAVDARRHLITSADGWRAALLAVSDAELDQVGYSTLPWGLDPTLPFLDIVWWVNKEVTHHGAEIAVLRDLYLHQSTP